MDTMAHNDNNNIIIVIVFCSSSCIYLMSIK